MQASKITTKGQVTIPQKMRKLLGIRAGDRVAFEIDDEGKVMVRKVDSRVSMAGVLSDRITKPATDKDIAIAIQDSWKSSGRN